MRYFLLIIIGLTFYHSHSYAESSHHKRRLNDSDKANSLIYADEVVYDRDLDVILAKGHVEIIHKGRVLIADKVTYSKKTDLLTAYGNVKLKEPSGEIIFLDYLESTSDFKNGFVNHIRMLFPDESRLVANRARREKGELTHFEQLIYSPCKLCKNDPTKPPLWQVKARHAEWDETKENIYYTDAFLEMSGIPIIFIPYFSHPAPNVKRRSGLLAPAFSYITGLNSAITTPVFWVLSEDKDITLSPTFFSKNFFMLEAEYRQRFEKGEFDISGSITSGEKLVDRNTGKKIRESGKARWHIFSKTRYEFTESIRGGIKIERASDATYFSRYKNLGITRKNMLTSKAYLEGFWGRNYGQVQTMLFQGLREGDRNKTTPLILPMVDYNFISQPDTNGGRLSFDGNILSLTRRQGANVRRFSGIAGWQVPYLSSWGEVYTFGLKVRGDAYNVERYHYVASPFILDKVFKGTLLRGLPQANAQWRMPFVRVSQDYRIIAEPIVGFVASPNIKHPQKLPNEDSRFFELDDINLFSDSRMAGLDRIDGGIRLNYGFNTDGFSKENGNTNLFIGQSFTFSKPQAFFNETGVHRKFSDYVARFKYNYKEWIALKTRFLLSRQNFSPKRSEVAASIGKPILRFHTDFIQLQKLFEDPNDKPTKQIRFILSSNFTENWTASIGTTRGLGKNRKSLENVGSLTYQDECFTLVNSISKTFYVDKDVRPGVTYMFTIVFKNLGEISQSWGNKSDSRRPGAIF